MFKEMRINEVIEELIKVRELHGNVRICGYSGSSGMHHNIDHIVINSKNVCLLHNGRDYDRSSDW
jgi:hypothetical protein